MSRNSRRMLSLLVAALAAGCAGLPGAPAPTKAGRPILPVGVASKAPGPASAPPASDAPASASPTPIGSVAPSVGTFRLAGRIVAPSRLVGNNGGGYRLLASLEQVPYAGAVVRLVDAAGVPVPGPDGQPLMAKTDAEGRYGFTAALPESHVLLEVALPADRGTLRAIAPRGETRTDADLVSTLTTGYILDQYVKGQQRPVETLAKLPTDVEAATRAKAAAALQGGTTAVPETLTAEQVVTTVEALRRQDASFNDQMETVKKLLVAAGQSNLGDGRPALEVAIGGVRGLLPTTDGGMFIACPGDRRIWRLRPDGILETAAGSGSVAAAVDGLSGPQAGLDGAAIALDADGRLLIAEPNRLSRLGSDGKLKVLWPGAPAIKAVAATAEAVWVATANAEAAELWAILPNGTRERRHTYTAADSRLIRATSFFGADGQGGIMLLTKVGPDDCALIDLGCARAVYRLDLTTKTLVKQVDEEENNLQDLGLDASGNLFTVDRPPSFALRVRRPGGTAQNIQGYVGGSTLDRLALGSDGTLYYTRDSAVGTTAIYRQVGSNAAVPIAGRPEPSGQAGDLAFLQPAGLAPGTGAFFVADKGHRKVFRVSTEGQVSAVAGSSDLGALEVVRTDSQGALSVLVDAGRILKLAANGTSTPVFEAAPEEFIADFGWGPDGALYAACYRFAEKRFVVVRKSASGRDVLYEGAASSYYQTFAFAVAPDRQLHVLDGSRLYRVPPAGGAALVVEDVRLGGTYAPVRSSIALDAGGRVYVANPETDQVLRVEPGTKAVVAIAGPGTSRFSGLGVDDSLQDPCFPALDADGNLLVSDQGHRQVKKIAADQL